jgi:hypothetical protein
VAILVDSSVILDVVTEDPVWFEWSSRAVTTWAERDTFVINPLVYAEVSAGFTRIEDLENSVPSAYFRRVALPWEAAFLAGKCFLDYRRGGGSRRSPLPDFYIGAHAAVAGLRPMTRDVVRFRTYFPTVELIAPE